MNADVTRGSFTVREFAQAHGLGCVKTYELVMSGRVRSLKVGARRLIPATELREFPARQLAEQGAAADSFDR
jgi:excisionase family DNA binding protein